MSSVLQYNRTTNTKSKPTFFLLRHPFLFSCLITCLLPLCVLPLFLCYLFCLSTGFVFSLLLHVHAWSNDATSKCKFKRSKCKEEDASPKRVMFRRLGGLASPCGYLFLSLSLSLSLEPCILIWVSFLCILLRPHSLGIVMSDLHFLYHIRSYPLDVGNVYFIYPVPCFGHIP